MILGLGFRPFPLPESNKPEHLMRLRKSIVEFHQLVRQATPFVGLRMSEQPSIGELPMPEAKIGQGELRVQRDGAIEMLGSLSVTLLGQPASSELTQPVVIPRFLVSRAAHRRGW